MVRSAIFFLFICAALAEKIQFQPCDSASQESCRVYDAEVDPCPDGSTGEPCKLKRGKPASIFFKYNPTWTTEGVLKTRAYWVSVVDIPFAGIDSDGCKVTTCPPVQNAENYYNFTLDIAKSYPPNRYDVKFKLWDDVAEKKKKNCCMVFKIKII
uniref:Putative niemann-pick type c2 n=1 Tax=Panstrongylus lignarius TaxID=156445 RepID=A0A224XYZ6_9HEMI